MNPNVRNPFFCAPSHIMDICIDYLYVASIVQCAIKGQCDSSALTSAEKKIAVALSARSEDEIRVNNQLILETLPSYYDVPIV